MCWDLMLQNCKKRNNQWDWILSGGTLHLSWPVKFLCWLVVAYLHTYSPAAHFLITQRETSKVVCNSVDYKHLNAMCNFSPGYFFKLFFLFYTTSAVSSMPLPTWPFLVLHLFSLSMVRILFHPFFFLSQCLFALPVLLCVFSLDRISKIDHTHMLMDTYKPCLLETDTGAYWGNMCNPVL